MEGVSKVRGFENMQLSELFSEDATTALERQKRWISALLHIMQVAGGTLSMDEILYAVSQEMIKGVGAWACNAFLFPERCKYGNYYLVEPVPSLDYRVPDPPDRFTMEALETARPVIAQDVMADPRTDKRTMRYFGIKSALAFPMVFQGKAVAAGFMCFDKLHEFTDEEVEIVMAIANAGAMAVAHAKLHDTAIQLAIAQERNRLAQEMHDSVCQSLATIKLNLSTLLYEQRLDSVLAEKISRIKILTDESYNDVRDIIHSFRTAGISPEQFTETFDRYVETYGARNGIDVENLLRDKDINLLNQTSILQIGRILGEALSNVNKHSKAKHIRISSANDGKNIAIEVQDDGIGFDVDSTCTAAPQHFGLSIMKERAQACNGTLKLTRRSPHGTCVLVTIPYL